jgi:hypothetical protein
MLVDNMLILKGKLPYRTIPVKNMMVTEFVLYITQDSIHPKSIKCITGVTEDIVLFTVKLRVPPMLHAKSFIMKFSE